MGAPDAEVHVQCPECDGRVVFVTMFAGRDFAVDDAPAWVLGSLVGHEEECANCGAVVGFEAERPRVVVRAPQPGACPFCGATGAFLAAGNTAEGFRVRCSRCGAEGPRSDEQRIAVAAWNRARPKGE